MNTFHLKIVTPDGEKFNGQAEELIVRTTTGDMGIMAGHVNVVAPLGMGRATVITEGNRRYAACIGGMVSMVNGQATIVATTFEWAEDIDLDRTNNALKYAQEQLKRKDLSKRDLQLAEAKLRRALVRKSVATGNK